MYVRIKNKKKKKTSGWNFMCTFVGQNNRLALFDTSAVKIAIEQQELFTPIYTPISKLNLQPLPFAVLCETFAALGNVSSTFLWALTPM